MTLLLLVMAAETWYLHPAFTTVVGTVFGGGGLKLVEHFLNKDQSRASLRRDFNAEIKELVERIDKLEDEVTEWRTAYYAEQAAVAKLRVAIINLGGEVPE